MIFDKKENASLYKSLSANLKTALDYLETADFNAMEPGTVTVDGKNVYALIQAKTTRLPQDAKWEGHKEYIDIQYVYEGEEKMAVQPADEMNVSVPLNTEKDILFFEDNSKGSDLFVKAGGFAIFFPTDAHRPLLAIDTPKPVKKVVIKVKI